MDVRLARLQSLIQLLCEFKCAVPKGRVPRRGAAQAMIEGLGILLTKMTAPPPAPPPALEGMMPPPPQASTGAFLPAMASLHRRAPDQIPPSLALCPLAPQGDCPMPPQQKLLRLRRILVASFLLFARQGTDALPQLRPACPAAALSTACLPLACCHKSCLEAPHSSCDCPTRIHASPEPPTTLCREHSEYCWIREGRIRLSLRVPCSIVALGSCSAAT